MLRLTLAINSDRIADYEIKRVSNTASRPHPEDVNDYQVRAIPSMQLLTSVRHRYGDGAQSLALRVLTELEGATP